MEHSYKLNVTVLDSVDPVRQKNDLSDATEPMLQATIVRGLWRKQGTTGRHSGARGGDLVADVLAAPLTACQHQMAIWSELPKSHAV